MTFKHFYPNSIIKLNQSFIMNFHFMSPKEVEVFSLPIDISILKQLFVSLYLKYCENMKLLRCSVFMNNLWFQNQKDYV